MGPTIKKLGEAGFFLRQMEDRNPNETTFDYYMNAFIGSARSVLWVMQNEYADTPGWRPWYESKRLTADEELLLKQINELRIRSVKMGQLASKTRFELTFAIRDLTDEVAVSLEQALRNFGGRQLRVNASLGEGGGIEIGKGQVSFSGVLKEMTNLGHFLDSFPETDSLEVCKQYFALLQKWVTECTLDFGEPGR